MITKTKTDYIISLAEAKDHLNLDADFLDKDVYINSLIKSAVMFAENYIGKDIATTENVYVIEKYSGNTIEIDEGNLTSISSISDEAGTITDYTIDYSDSSFIINLAKTVSPEQEVTVNFVTGFSAVTIPAPIKQAILIKIGDLYDIERSDYVFTTVRKTQAFENLLQFYVAQRIKFIKN